MDTESGSNKRAIGGGGAGSCGGGRLGGSKVSQIANIFQSMVPTKEDGLKKGVPLRSADSSSSSSPPPSSQQQQQQATDAKENAGTPSQVTVVRTESHVARFNNARALFEKLGGAEGGGGGSDGGGRGGAGGGGAGGGGASAGGHAARPAKSEAGRRGRPGSAGSCPFKTSRSPSPTAQPSRPASSAAVLGDAHPVTANGHAHEANGAAEDDDDSRDSGDWSSCVADQEGGSEGIKDRGKESGKTSPPRVVDAGRGRGIRGVRPPGPAPPVPPAPPAPLVTPQKPERKPTSRELIEKQRNWTSHFAKSTRASSPSSPAVPTRYHSDPQQQVAAAAAAQRTPASVAKPTAGNAGSTARSASFSTSRPSGRHGATSPSLRAPSTPPPPPPPAANLHHLLRNRERHQTPSTNVGANEKDVDVEVESRECGEEKQEREAAEKESAPEISSPEDHKSGSSQTWQDSEEVEVEKKKKEEVVEEILEDFIVPPTNECHNSQKDTEVNQGLILQHPAESPAEKRCREEDAGEVRVDVAHVDKRSKCVTPFAFGVEACGVITGDVDKENSFLGTMERSPTRDVTPPPPGFDHDSPVEQEKQEKGIVEVVSVPAPPPGFLDLGGDLEYADEGDGFESNKEDGKTKEAVKKPEQQCWEEEREGVSVNGVMPTVTVAAIPPGRLSDDQLAKPPPVLEGSQNQEPDTMTPDEAEKMLSAKQQALLSDEEAQEVKKLLLPTAADLAALSSPVVQPLVKEDAGKKETKAEKGVEEEGGEKEEEEEDDEDEEEESEEGDWAVAAGAYNPSLAEDSSITSSSTTMQDSTLDYSHVGGGSQSGSESGLLGSVNSLNNDQEGAAAHEEDINSSSSTTTTTEASFLAVQPGKEAFVENGVHYLEDGHFWMEVPGLPETDDDDEDGFEGLGDGEDSDYPIPVKRNTKVTFSTGPIKVYSTYSVGEYDRRNEDVDPVAASAEYELEKRVERMEVMAVGLRKGAEGLGLSIIGMGVGADAGLEKLGIFVKTITEGGAAARDGRIQVNDQIIEVDGKSLVGVTQAYAASVLRNTSGLVHFLIGREKDPQNSEVAQLIRQSLQADREREEQRQRLQQQHLQQQQFEATYGTSRYHHHHHHHHHHRSEEDTSITSQHSSSPASPSTPAPVPVNSASNSPSSPSAPETSPSMQMAGDASEVETLRRMLKENQYRLAMADADISRLKARINEVERSNGTGTSPASQPPDNEEYVERLRQMSLRLRETERGLHSTRQEVASYQDMLEQSQGQYIALDRKYGKAKRLLREFQQREADLLHREEFHLQLLQEKDTEYNALVKALKDRVIQLEQELQETQRSAGLPVHLPYDSTSLRQLTPQLSRKHNQVPPVKPLLQQLEAELSDTEISDISPEDTDKTATVERKMPVKEELDRAVPPHELLDVSASKAKADLATRGGLAGRQLPSSAPVSATSSSTTSSSSNVPVRKGSCGALSNSSSEYGLEESYHSSVEVESLGESKMVTTNVTHTVATESHAMAVETHTGATLVVQTSRPTTLLANSVPNTHLSSFHPTSNNATSHHPPTAAVQNNYPQISQQQQQQQSQQLLQQALPTQHNNSQVSNTVNCVPTSTSITSPSQVLYHRPPTDAWGASRAHTQQTQHQTYPHAHGGPPTGPPPSLAEQLKQVLAERERRLSAGEQRGGSGSDSESSGTGPGKTGASSSVSSVPATLVEEIRQAVQEANARVKKVPLSQNLAVNTSPWQQGRTSPQRVSDGMAPPSPSSVSSSSCSASPHALSRTPDRDARYDIHMPGDVWTHSGLQDSILSSSAPSSTEKKSMTHLWQSAPVSEWSKEQVCQWLLALGLEQHIPRFMEERVGGCTLLTLESRELKALGVSGEDKSRLKRKLKELRVQVEREKKQAERERKEKERLQRKAEKLAEKASRANVGCNMSGGSIAGIGSLRK